MRSRDSCQQFKITNVTNPLNYTCHLTRSPATGESPCGLGASSAGLDLVLMVSKRLFFSPSLSSQAMEVSIGLEIP